MTFITHGFRVSVVSYVRERVRDFRITFALYVKKIFISGVCQCATLNVFTKRRKKIIQQYVQPCLSKNTKYTFYAIKSSMTLAYYLQALLCGIKIILEYPYNLCRKIYALNRYVVFKIMDENTTSFKATHGKCLPKIARWG